MASDIMRLGTAINCRNPGRISETHMTLFDGTGIGLQVLAVAAALWPI
ncbi:hypothetical protein [Primorskyibacter sp. 2E233]